jgi:hypothetical protein
MFEDILKDEDPKPFKFGPSDIHVNYFKDGEGFEFELSITSQELLNALPAFPPMSLIENGPEKFVEFIKAHLLLEKCLLFESNVV